MDITKLKKKYMPQLIKGYEKGGLVKFFLDQYAQGGGQELNQKFWSSKSSSRLAFDLYSWMADSSVNSVKDFEFEFRLPGLASGGSGANMDVYVETEKEAIFIESKFSEKAKQNWLKTLSEAYTKTGIYGSKGKSLNERYYNKCISKYIVDFIKEISSCDVGKSDWFDPKQEICHTIGIFLMLLGVDINNRKATYDTIRSKEKICLYNVYWNFNNKEEKNPNTLKVFKKAFNNLVSEIKSECVDIRSKDIIFDAFTIDDVIHNQVKLSDDIVFPSEIENKITPYKEFVSDRNRWEM